MPSRPRFPVKALARAVIGALVVAGCAGQAPLQTMQKSMDIDSSVIGLSNDDGVESLAVEAEAAFVLRDTEESEPLPAIRVPKLSFTERSVSDVLRMVLKDTDISLSIQGSASGTEEAYGAATVYNLQGSLGEVLDRMSRQAGFFYTYRDKVLTIRPERQYLVTLPPAVVEDTYAGITNNILALGAQSPYLDRIGRTLMFKANRTAAARIEEYVNYMRSNRQLIVYDVMIYSVELNDSFNAGINWGAIAANSSTGGTPTRPLLTTTPNSSGGVTTFDNLTTNPLGLSATFLLSRFNTGVLVSLLKTYGSVKKVSQPRIAIISGGSGHFRQGRNTTYVSKVGNNYGTSINSVTVETASLTTGITLRMSGDVSGGTVHTRIALKIQEFLGFNGFTALGTQLQLPDTADRELGTEIVAPIGSAALLGGILVQNADKSTSGLPGGSDGSGVSIPLSVKNSTNTAELVFIISPRVYRFNKVKEAAVAQTAVPPQSAVVIKGGLDGARVAPAAAVAPMVAPAAAAPIAAAIPTPVTIEALVPTPPKLAPLPKSAVGDGGRAMAAKMDEYQPVASQPGPKALGAPVASVGPVTGQQVVARNVEMVAAPSPVAMDAPQSPRRLPTTAPRREVMRDQPLEVW